MPPFDNAYEAVTEENDHTHWAFGTGFADPLAGVDPAIPPGLDRHTLAGYCLALGDDALIMSHRLCEWCTNAPELEDEVALANIALDLLGQARLLLGRSAQASGTGDEDSLAFWRDAGEFGNVLLVEQPRGDFAHEIVRLLMFSSWRLALLRRLVDAADPVLAAVAEKGVKELAYHRDYAAGWAVRLGDGTDHSHERMVAAVAAVWPYLPELFTTHDLDRHAMAAGLGPDPESLRGEFDQVVDEVFAAARLVVPRSSPAAGTVRAGGHTPALTDLLAELQGVARTNPDATW